MINISNQKKYEILESDFIDYENKKLYRIVSKISDSELRIKEGDLGGYVEGYHNLSQEGRCWIYFGSIACEESEVRDNAVLGNPDMLEISELLYDSQIDRATCGVIMKGSSKVMGNSIIDTVNCEISGTTKIHGGVYLINEELLSDRNCYKYCKKINLDDELIKKQFPRFFDEVSITTTKKKVDRENLFDKDVSKVLILGNSEIGDPELDGTGYSSTLKDAVENDSFVLISGRSAVIDNCIIKGKVSIACAVLVDSEIYGENKGTLYNKLSNIAINNASLPKKFITELKKGNSVSKGAINSLSFIMPGDKVMNEINNTYNTSMFNLSEGLSNLLNRFYDDFRRPTNKESEEGGMIDLLFSETHCSGSQSSFIYRVTRYINSTMGVSIDMTDSSTKQEVESLYDFLKFLKKDSNADKIIKAFTKVLRDSVDSASFRFGELCPYLLVTAYRSISSSLANKVKLDEESICNAIKSGFKRSQVQSYYYGSLSYLFPAIILNSSIKGGNIHIDPSYYEGIIIIDSTITGSAELTRSIIVRSKIACNTESVFVNSSVPGYKRNIYKPSICGDYWGEPLNKLSELIGDYDFASPLDISAEVIMTTSQFAQVSIVDKDNESEVTDVYNYLYESIVLESELVGAMYTCNSIIYKSEIHSDGKIKYYHELFDKLRKDFANEEEQKGNIIENVLTFYGRSVSDYISSTFLDPCIVTDSTYFSGKFAYECRNVTKNAVVIDSKVTNSGILSAVLKESELNHAYLVTMYYYGASTMRIIKSAINNTLFYTGKGIYQFPTAYSGSFYTKGVIVSINESKINNSKICLSSTIPASELYRKFIFTMSNSSIYNSILQLTGGKLLESNELDQCHYYKEAKKLGILKFINRNKAYMNVAFNLIDRNIINLNKQHISSRSIDSKVRIKSNGSAKFSADIIKDIILSRKLKRKESLEELLNITRKEASNG